MSIESNLKTLLGEYTFQICALQVQLEEANNKIEELTKETKKEKDVSSRTK